MKLSKNRKSIIAFLLMLSLILTSGTFAFWANSIEGTASNATNSLTIGSGDGVETTISVSSNKNNTEGYLVPKGQAVNSIGLVKEQADFLYELTWNEKQDVSQIGTDLIYGDLQTKINILIEIDESKQKLDQTDYNDIYELINIVTYDTNPTKLLLNDEKISLFGFTLTMDEPRNKTQYDLISSSTIYVTTEFIIEANIFDINLDFTSMSQQDLLNSGVVSRNITDWVTEENKPLMQNGGGHEKFIFFPITKDEYTVTVEASLNNIYSSSGGYGILFDTYFDGDGFSKDNGYILQFDRGYADGEMIIRPRVNGYERNAYWREQSRTNNHFPTKQEDPEWWVQTHELSIKVSNIDSDTRQAEIFLDGILLGTATYQDEVTTEQQYVGFRLWGHSTTDFYSLKVE